MPHTNPYYDPKSRLYLGRADAAAYIRDKFGIRCAKQTLAKLAVIGGGPPYRLAGRTPLYAPNDLDNWALSRISEPRTSTSDGGSEAA